MSILDSCCGKCEDIETENCYGCYKPYLEKFGCYKCKHYHIPHPEQDDVDWVCNANLNPIDLYEIDKLKKCKCFDEIKRKRYDFDSNWEKKLPKNTNEDERMNH